jgi:hypothetical protein
MRSSDPWRFWPRRYWLGGRIPTPAQHWEREHYIPLKPNELADHLAELPSTDPTEEPAEEPLSTTIDTSPASHTGPASHTALFGRLCHRIEEVIHQQYRSDRQKLIELYESFDPDADPRLVPGKNSLALDATSRDTYSRQLFQEIADWLQHANYRRLKPSEIQDAIATASHWGVRLRVRFGSFRRLEVYARGDIIAKRTRRDWRKGFKLCEFDVPIYQRLVVVFRTKELQNLPDLLDPNCVHVRMFKNIPKVDVDMMLPGSQVRLNWTDTGKIGVPTLWGLFMLASKLVKSFWLVTLLGALKVFSSFLLVVAIIVASIVYGIKSTLSYSTAKRRYQLNVARSLYYQNLDNNLGALLRIVEEAEQQEICEAILAYYVMAQSNGTTMAAVETANFAMQTQQIDTEAERILRAITGTDVDFDVNDALRDLVSIGIAMPEVKGWRALDLENAIVAARATRA